MPARVEGVSQRFVEANGLRFHVAECGAGERLALCLHGFPELWYSWRHQMPLLAGLGWRVWAPDLRGYGETERPARRQDYRPELLLQDVAGLVDAAGARELMLVGHDWGAILAWLFAQERVRPLSRLVVMNGPLPAAFRRAMRHPSQLLRSWYAFFFLVPGLPERLLGAGGARRLGEVMRRTACHPERFPPETTEVFRQAAAQPGAIKAMLDYYRCMLGPEGRRYRRLERSIDVPTLLLWGEKDVALSRRCTLDTGRWVEKLTLRYLPEASHWVQQDEPELVNAMLAAWLAGAPVPEAEPGGYAGREGATACPK